MKPIIVLFAVLFSISAHAQNDTHRTPHDPPPQGVVASSAQSGLDGKGKGYKYDKDGNKISHEEWEAQQETNRTKNCLKSCQSSQTVPKNTTQSGLDGKGKGYKYDRDGNKISHEEWEAQQEANRLADCLNNCQSGGPPP